MARYLYVQGNTLDGAYRESPRYYYSNRGRRAGFMTRSKLRAHTAAMRWISKQGGGSFQIAHMEA